MTPKNKFISGYSKVGESDTILCLLSIDPGLIPSSTHGFLNPTKSNCWASEHHHYAPLTPPKKNPSYLYCLHFLFPPNIIQVTFHSLVFSIIQLGLGQLFPLGFGLYLEVLEDCSWVGLITGMLGGQVELRGPQLFDSSP